ncbi:hypothetical protein MNB_SV-5-764 [hydrothermal vent metagenome]|uniref:Molybdopterin synthase sulfur carrier subunit n=1 Tax=hydrothermal vent metagenome TaxID=652676 RepID=A0A1W1ECD9_9ZZZZ
MSNNINVTVKLFAQYREGRFKIEHRVYKKGTTAQEVIHDVGIDEHRLPLGVLMVNSRHVEESYVLQDNDVIALFPKVGGG